MSGLKVDIGCGPHMRDEFDVFVDRYLSPVSRHGGVIRPEAGKRFVMADSEALPFKSGAFEYANCANLLEHLEHPGRACEEIMRIAKAGYIICPGVFDEIFFGKPYHLWLTMARGSKIWFFRKRDFEDRPFGRAFIDALRPGDRRYLPEMPELRVVKEAYLADRKIWRLFGQPMHWKGSFEWEEVE